jgi:hypothetical protein
MLFNISSNISSNYIIVGTAKDIASLSYYPLLFLILTILPIIIIIITLSLKLSNRTKIYILYFNIIYSMLLPVIGMSIIEDFQIKFYIYETILKDSSIASTLYSLELSLIEIYQEIVLLTKSYIIINIMIITVIWILSFVKKFKNSNKIKKYFNKLNFKRF